MSAKFVEAKNRKEVEREYPSAAKIVKVEGGYMAFESVEDYRVWKNQK